MSITVDWPSLVINVPKADTTLVQALPTEIRKLDLNAFRLALKDLEDNEQGINWPITHRHNPPVLVGGVELARVVEIINGYTVTFEDGQYAVNLFGANSNVADRVNVNKVSVRSANSAGLVTSSAIEYGEYGGGVTIDTANMTGNAATGSLYPTGTLRRPCLVLADALVIANSRGFQRIYVIGNADFTAAHNVDGMIITGTSHVQNQLYLQDGADCENTVFRDLEIFGVLDGNNELNDCIVNSLTYFSGHIHHCGLKGTITLAGDEASVISDCKTIDPFSPPTIDMGGSGQDLAMPGYSGLLTIKNMNGLNMVGIGLLGGTVRLDSTVVLGVVQVAGVGSLEDMAGNAIETGTWNGGVSVINQTITEDSVVEKVWSIQGSLYPDAGTMGEALISSRDGILRTLGLLHENSYLDNTVYDENKNLLTARRRCFDSKANKDAATYGGSETTGLIATYTIEASYNDDGITLKDYQESLE